MSMCQLLYCFTCVISSNLNNLCGEWHYPFTQVKNRKISKVNSFAQGHPVRNSRDSIKALSVCPVYYAMELVLITWKSHHNPVFQFFLYTKVRIFKSIGYVVRSECKQRMKRKHVCNGFSIVPDTY